MELSTKIPSLVIFASIFLVQGAASLPNLFCKPHPTLVALGHPEYEYFPYFVTLHRCVGSCGTSNPNNKGCVVLSYTDIFIPSLSFKTNQQKMVITKNHTRCGCKCLTKKSDCNLKYQRWDGFSCECQCLHKNSPPSCPNGTRWNSKDCQCECTKVPTVCTVNKNWSNGDCKCVQVNDRPKSRRTRKRRHKHSEKRGVSSTLMVVFIVVEFAVLYIVFDAILYHKQAGLFYRIQLKFKKQGSSLERVSRNDICREMQPGDPIEATVTITGKETAI